MLTTLELPLLIAVIIAGIYLSFKYNPLFGGTHMLKKRAASDPDILGVFVCMYRWRPIKSPLFITKDRIWYELLGTMQFEFAVKDIEEVTYIRGIEPRSKVLETFILTVVLYPYSPRLYDRSKYGFCHLNLLYQ
jgi:hypothetical protein